MSVKSPVKDTTSSSEYVPPQPDKPQASIVDTLPLKLVMMLAAPYLAGKNATDALEKAHKVYKDSRFASTIDILGEDATNDQDCDTSVENYKQLISMIAANPVPCTNPLQQVTVSFKPSMFCTTTPGASESATKQTQLDRAYQRIESIVAHAKNLGIRVTLEAEDHNWTSFHLDSYFALINSGYLNCGTVIQSRLFRTKEDIRKFDDRMRVRMVIGIYNEPANIALTQKPDMKKVAVDYAAELLSRGTYVELASHDEECMHNFIDRAVLPNKAQSDRFEIQHLLGVPRKDIQVAFGSGQYFVSMAEKESGARREHLADLARTGVLLRMYLPFGTDNVAGPYCKRRLKANPNMIGFGIKNFFNIK